MEFKHVPVLKEETIENLFAGASQTKRVFVDGTLGGGGHSEEIAKRLEKGDRLIGIDQDREAIAAATQRLRDYEKYVTIVHDNYEDIPQILEDLGIDAVDGILLDLGVSSYQLDNPQRGFSYITDEVLDMRMDQDNPVSAYTIVNTYSEEELVRILRDYGEERYAVNIAKRIVSEREKAPISTTGELSSIIRRSVPLRMQGKYGNPCKRSFQAIRIACNRELDVLEASMDALISLLKPGGRICIITFHSLEDRIVKNAFKRNENPCTCPPEFPVCICGKTSKGKIVTRKPIVPTPEEITQNRRSSSAKLRVFEKAKNI